MLKARHSLGMVFFPAFDWALSPTHPEREERLLYTQDQLQEEGLFDVEGIAEYKPLVATVADIERTHFCFPETERLVTRSHRIAAGGAIRAADLVMRRERDKAFALVRPPGHHAGLCVLGNRGFCTINNEAVMVEHLRETYGVRRVAIIDTDCHHGDGTQDIYWHDPDVLFISLHQDGRSLYPGTGFPHECGGPKARGRTINIPLPPQTGDAGYLHIIEQVVLPILAHFQPEVVINSAGQDNHFTDPLTDMNVTARGYARLNQLLNPHIAVLEGGYAIQGALPYVNLGIALSMAGMDYDHVVEPDYDPRTLAAGERVTPYLQKLAEELPRLYFSPPPPEAAAENGVFVRQREIFYDTDHIRETQREYLRDCDHCPGVLRLESRSNVTPLSLGILVPVGGCEQCAAEGLRQFEEGQVREDFRYAQYINRRDKDYRRSGF